MHYRFSHHYTVVEARQLLPQIRQWLEEFRRLSLRAERLDTFLGARIEAGEDMGGARVNESVRTLHRLAEIEQEFSSREIQLKDLERGLIDFPSLRGHREVFLCWEEKDQDIEYWHDLETGFAGREPV